MYGIRENDVRGINDVSPFVKEKRDLDVLPPTHGALELHIINANYQAKILLQAAHVIQDLENKPTKTIELWHEGKDRVNVVLKCLLAISFVCMKTISCLCKTKCMSMRRECSKASLKCTPACRFDVIGIPNLTYSN